MAYFHNSNDINQTFIIEQMLITGETPTITACTSVFSNALSSCSGNTTIFMGDGVISFNGNLYTNDDLSANQISATTFYSGGTNLFNIVESFNITGGTFNKNTDTLNLYKSNGNNISISGFSDYYTTGTTLIGNTVYFDRNDQLSAYTLNLDRFANDIYTTGLTFNDNQIIITRNDGVSLNTFINTFTGLTINGLLTTNELSAITISATTFYGDGSNLTGISTQDTMITGGTYSNGDAIFTNNTGGTFSVTGFSTGYTLTSSEIDNALGYTPLSAYTDTYVSGGTYNISNGIATFVNNTGGMFNVTGFNTGYTLTSSGITTALGYTPLSAYTDTYVSGFSFNPSTYELELGQSNDDNFVVNLAILASDMTITGGTYDSNTGVATFTNNSGGTFNVTGFLTGFTDIYTTGATYNPITGEATFTRNDGNSYSTNGFYTGGTSNPYVTGFTNSNNTFTISDNTGQDYSTTLERLTGLTINGSLSATTYYGDGSNLSGITNNPIVVTTDITAENNKIYHVIGNVRITPPDPVAGLGFEVYVISGNAKIDSETYYTGAYLTVFTSGMFWTVENYQNQSPDPNLAFVIDITRTALIGEYSGFGINPKAQYRITDALSGTSVIRVYGISNGVTDTVAFKEGSFDGSININGDLGTYNILTDIFTPKANNASSSTGTVISFDESKIYNTRTSAATGNITGDYTNAKIGIVQKIYHNDSTIPTFPGTWVRLGSGTYTTSTLNIIFVEWTSSNIAEYWISKTF